MTQNSKQSRCAVVDKSQNRNVFSLCLQWCPRNWTETL